MLLIDIDLLTLKDINKLVDELRFSENDKIEYKGQLPYKGQEQEPWYEGADKISNKAVEKLTAEIVAFGNANGGRLYLGISENNETPAKPEKIFPLPRVHELSLRLEQSINDCIEPPIRGLKVKVIETGKDEGLIIFEIPRSERSPHRSTKDNECYQRVSHQCKKMTMDEIQHLSVKQPRERVEGLWLCFFGELDKFSDSGITVLSNGRVYGGDGQFHYSGMYEIINGNQFSAILKIEHHHGDNYTTFGTREKTFNVHVNAIISENKIAGTLTKLTAPQRTVQIILHKRQSLL